MRNQAERARAFRALHERPGIFIMPNPWDAGTAKLFASLGFEALATTSLGFSSSRGRVDGTLCVSREELIANCREIASATDLPVNADLENGYADDPEEAATIIRLAAEAGPPLPGSLALCRFRSPSRRAPRTTCTDAPTSTTRSAACRRSPPPARTCSTRLACATSKPSGSWWPRCRSRSTS